MSIMQSVPTKGIVLENIAESGLSALWQKALMESDGVSTSITQTWTDQAIKCYLTDADCSSCSVPRGNYSFVCQMNKVVPVLLRNLGTPDPVRLNKLLPYIHHY